MGAMGDSRFQIASGKPKSGKALGYLDSPIAIPNFEKAVGFFKAEVIFEENYR